MSAGSRGSNLPEFTAAQIITFFKGLSVQLSIDDFKSPNAEALINAMYTIVHVFMDPPKIDFKQAPFHAVEQITYPELYEQGIADMETYQNILRLCWAIGLPHISIKHLMFPDPQHTKEMLSAAMNFGLFQAEHAKMYAEFEAKITELMELKGTADEELDTLEPELEQLRASYAKVAPVIKTRKAEMDELTGLVGRLNKEQSELKEQTKKLKAEIADVGNQTNNQKFLIATATQELEKLRAQVIKSPEKLRGRLAQLEIDIENKRRELAEENNKLRDMKAESFAVNKVLNKLAKRVATMKECEEDKKKAKELHQELKHKAYDSQKEDEKLQELKATAQHLEQQISSFQEKLLNLQIQGEQKRAIAQQALDETERQKRELAYSIQMDKEQVRQNHSIIQRKETEVQYMAQAHKREMDTLKKHYAQFAKSLRLYHSEIMAATRAYD
jgi:chromosome segregation ATPase